jgi:hypothetical protein
MQETYDFLKIRIFPIYLKPSNPPPMTSKSTPKSLMPMVMELSLSRIFKHSLFSLSVGKEFLPIPAVKPTVALIPASTQHRHIKMFKKMIFPVPILTKILNGHQNMIPKLKPTEATASTQAHHSTIKPTQTLQTTSTPGTKKTNT